MGSKNISEPENSYDETGSISTLEQDATNPSPTNFGGIWGSLTFKEEEAILKFINEKKRMSIALESVTDQEDNGQRKESIVSEILKELTIEKEKEEEERKKSTADESVINQELAYVIEEQEEETIVDGSISNQTTGAREETLIEPQRLPIEFITDPELDNQIEDDGEPEFEFGYRCRSQRKNLIRVRDDRQAKSAPLQVVPVKKKTPFRGIIVRDNENTRTSRELRYKHAPTRVSNEWSSLKAKSEITAEHISDTTIKSQLQHVNEMYRGSSHKIRSGTKLDPCISVCTRAKTDKSVPVHDFKAFMAESQAIMKVQYLVIISIIMP